MRLPLVLTSELSAIGLTSQVVGPGLKMGAGSVGMLIAELDNVSFTVPMELAIASSERWRVTLLVVWAKVTLPPVRAAADKISLGKADKVIVLWGGSRC